MRNKEFGSDFHYINNLEFMSCAKTSQDFIDLNNLYFSGRVALRNILIYGIDQLKWEKIYIPTYYCHEVYDFIKDLDIYLEFYPCNILDNSLPTYIEDKSFCAVLVVNYFGISSPSFEHLKKIATIEDLTHDLCKVKDSKADFIFGSLRKALPLPVGGFVKSKLKLPEISCTLFAEEVALEKFTGMLLKKKYLDGQFLNKQVFREVLISAENSFGNLKTNAPLPLMVNEYLAGLNISKIIECRKKNISNIKTLIKLNPKFEVLVDDYGSEYSLILKFNDTIDRDSLKEYLIFNHIYPMVLWPGQVLENDINLQKTLLFVHVDFRYCTKEIEHIANIINQFFINV